MSLCRTYHHVLWLRAGMSIYSDILLQTNVREEKQSTEQRGMPLKKFHKKLKNKKTFSIKEGKELKCTHTFFWSFFFNLKFFKAQYICFGV